MKEFVEAVRKALDNQNWYTALFMALSFPDICPALEGRSQGSDRYKDWFNRYLGEEYHPVFTADNCYYFRCAALHAGRATTKGARNARDQPVHFIEPPPRNGIVHRNVFNGVLQMQVDVFSMDMCKAVDRWLCDKADDADVQTGMKELLKIHPFESLRPFIRCTAADSRPWWRMRHALKADLHWLMAPRAASWGKWHGLADARGC